MELGYPAVLGAHRGICISRFHDVYVLLRFRWNSSLTGNPNLESPRTFPLRELALDTAL